MSRPRVVALRAIEQEISTLLSSANPRHWPVAEMRVMLREHLDLTLTGAAARLKADWGPRHCDV